MISAERYINSNRKSRLKKKLPVNQIICGDALAALKSFPRSSIDMCMTSPPYWSLRDYGIEQIFGGGKGCEHEWEDKTIIRRTPGDIPGKTSKIAKNRPNDTVNRPDIKQNICLKCHAWKGQIGLEPTPELYIEHMTEIFNEVKRVLKKEGTLWLNIGDTYSTHTGKRSGQFGKEIKEGFDDIYSKNRILPLQEKCLCMIPERLAWSLIQNGWILRNKIIWYKPNAMPSSVRDRFSNRWEYIFMFSKSKKYYFDLDAVREPHTESGIERMKYPVSDCRGASGKSSWCRTKDNPKKAILEYNPLGKNPGDVFQFSKYDDLEGEKKYRQGLHKLRGNGIIEKRNLPRQKDFVNKLRENFTVEEIIKKTNLPKSQIEHWFRYDESGFSYPLAKDWALLKTNLFPELIEIYYESDSIFKSGVGKNPGDVFEINTQPFPETHFAVFPEKLCIKPIKAGCPEEVCKKCGKARERIIEREVKFASGSGKAGNPPKGKHENSVQSKSGSYDIRMGPQVSTQTIGWTSCDCNAGFEGGIVLDPFCGAGTALLVAKEMRRRFVGIDVKQEYCDMAEKRLAQGVL